MDGVERESRSVGEDGVRDLAGSQVVQSLVGHYKDFVTLEMPSLWRF